MPAYNFQARFVQLVESGWKKQTIRARRRDGREPKVGQLFVAYTGMRTKACRKLLTSSIIAVLPIEILAGVYLDGICLGPDAAHGLAIADGFSSANEMLGWFAENHARGRFSGHVIRWR